MTYLPEDVAVEREVASDWLVQSSGPFVAALDPRLDEALRREGLAREVVNRVQRIRKEAGYDTAIGSRSGSMVTPRCSMPCGHTPDSSGARRWLGGSRWWRARRHPTWSSRWTSMGTGWWWECNDIRTAGTGAGPQPMDE